MLPYSDWPTGNERRVQKGSITVLQIEVERRYSDAPHLNKTVWRDTKPSDGRFECTYPA